MKSPMRVLLCLALVCAASHAAGADEAISSESGFAGAVRVTDRWEDDFWGHVTVAIPYLDMRGDSAGGYMTLAMGEDLYLSCPVQPLGESLQIGQLRDLERRLHRNLALKTDAGAR
jgi:hypothetical protein